MQLGYQVFSSSLGELLVAGTAFAITHVVLGTDKSRLGSEFLMQHEEATSFGRTDYIKDACIAISDYLQGKSATIEVAIQVDGTEFQRKVWQALRQIPYGKTTNYTEIAEAIGEPDAVRAVANACGSNPVPLIIPCHRVIHKNGDVSGFIWGVETKRRLLDLEKEHATSLTQLHVA